MNEPPSEVSGQAPMSSTEFCVDVAAASMEHGAPAITVTVRTGRLELNIWIPQDELPLLDQVEAASWNARGSLRIGRCANSPVFWSSEAGEISILVGEDDETWDIGLTVPQLVFQEILRGIKSRA